MVVFCVGSERETAPKRVLPWSKIWRSVSLTWGRNSWGGGFLAHGVDALEEDVAEDVEGHAAAGLDAAVGHAVARVGEAEVLLLQGELFAADGEADDGELVEGGVGGVDVALLRGVVFAAGDRLVDRLAGLVVDEGEGRSGVGDGGVAGPGDGFAGHDGGGAVEHPEALGVVDGGVVGGLAAQGFLVDVAKGVEAFAFVGIVRVFDGAEVGGEELGGLGDVVLGDHVLDGSLHRGGSDGVDGSPGETEKPVAAVLLELGREALGQLDGLVFDDETAHIHDVRSHCARGGGTIPVGNLPGGTRGVLECAGLGGVEDSMLST